MKTCKECGAEKSLEDYYTYKHSGKVTYYARCKPCHSAKLKATYTNGQRAANRRGHRKRMRETVDKHKQVPCADCGKSYPSFVMDFDHVRGEKKYGIATMIGRNSLEELLAEIAKCDVVCANCHRMRTHSRAYSVHEN